LAKHLATKKPVKQANNKYLKDKARKKIKIRIAPKAQTTKKQKKKQTKRK
jgi:hypothetical protein